MNREMYDQYNMQSSLQQEASDSQMAPYAPQMMEQVQQNQAVLVAQTNPNKVLEDIKLKLEGKIKNRDGSLLSDGEPLMNKRGIDSIISIMSAIINQNTILSHLEDTQISRLIIFMGNKIIDDLTLNWRAYGIKDKTMLDRILILSLYPAFMALQRALGQNEKNWLGRISVENIAGGQRMGMKPKGSFWEKFKLG